MQKEASYYTKASRDFVECVLCPHNCHIPPSRYGICGVRRNVDGKLCLTTYGKISHMDVKPAVNLPLSPLFKDRSFLFIGSLGCNMKCPYCVSSRASQMGFPTRSMTPEKIIEKAQQENLSGIAMTYNEPTIGIEFVLDLARLCKAEGLLSAVATNGFLLYEPFVHLLQKVDVLTVHVSSWEPEFYRVECGGSKDIITRNISTAYGKVHIEVCYPVIEGVNDDDELVDDFTRWLSNVSPELPLHLVRFTPAFRFAEKAPTSEVRLYQVQRRAQHYLKHVYISEV